MIETLGDVWAVSSPITFVVLLALLAVDEVRERRRWERRRGEIQEAP